jgi:hypothetical protein
MQVIKNKTISIVFISFLSTDNCYLYYIVPNIRLIATTQTVVEGDVQVKAQVILLGNIDRPVTAR